MIEAEEHNSFVFGHKKLKNLKDLISVLENKDFEHIAKSHVTDEKNDFANWIHYVLKNEELAYNVSQERDLSKILEILKKEQEKHEIKKVAESRVEDLIKNPTHLKKEEKTVEVEKNNVDEVKIEHKSEHHHEADKEKSNDDTHLKKEVHHHKQVLEHSHPRHFCPKFFDCMKKEFLFGFALGIVVGIVIAILVKIGAI